MLSYSDLDAALEQYKKTVSVFDAWLSKEDPPLIVAMEKILNDRQALENKKRKHGEREVNVRNWGLCMTAQEHSIIAEFFQEDSECFSKLGITVYSFSNSATKVYSQLKEFGLLNKDNLNKMGGLSYWQLLSVFHSLQTLDLLNKKNVEKFIDVYAKTSYGYRNDILESISKLSKYHDRITDNDFRQLIFDKITDEKTHQHTIQHFFLVFDAKKMFTEERYIPQEELDNWLVYFILINKVGDSYLSEIVEHMARHKNSVQLTRAVFEMLNADPGKAKKLCDIIKSQKVENRDYLPLIDACKKTFANETKKVVTPLVDNINNKLR
ncbi:MAG: hypothetical protein WC748_05360 [Legionellales bacterium]|jgi:hypothetical protein